MKERQTNSSRSQAETRGALPRLRGRSGRHPGGEPLLPAPVCTHILETPCLPVGHVQAGGSREPLLTHLQPTTIRFVSYQCHTIRSNRILGRFREPPARQRLRNATLVCAISSGCGQPSKAAPLQRPRPGRPRKRGSAPRVLLEQLRYLLSGIPEVCVANCKSVIVSDFTSGRCFLTNVRSSGPTLSRICR